ncbi:MAG: Fe-S cluster assembly protein SufD [Myxococcota bacterium]
MKEIARIKGSDLNVATNPIEVSSGETKWLSELKRDAWKRFLEFDFPTGREEAWRYTDLSFLRPDAYIPYKSDSRAKIGPLRIPFKEIIFGVYDIEHSGKILHIDGSRPIVELSEEAKKKGVLLFGMDFAAKENPEILKEHLGKLLGANDIFTSLNLAAYQGGTLLYIPRGVCLDKPIKSFFWFKAGGVSIFPRNLIVIESGAKVSFVEAFASLPLSSPTLAAPATELFLGEGSAAGFFSWQNLGSGARFLYHLKARLEKDASLNSLTVTTGGDFSRSSLEFELAGSGAESDILGAYLAGGEQKFEHWTVQEHKAPDTRSDLLYKGALMDKANTVYYGTIKVREKAPRSDAYQANKNLILSPKAKAHTNPQLEIENNDVRCTHGAAVGRVSEEQLFYLMSRGLSKDDAKKLIVSGFFADVMARSTQGSIKESVLSAIEQKLIDNSYGGKEQPLFENIGENI